MKLLWGSRKLPGLGISLKANFRKEATNHKKNILTAHMGILTEQHTKTHLQSDAAVHSFCLSADWTYDSLNPDGQCRHGRHGLLCGRCPDCTYLSMNILSGRCVHKRDCYLSLCESILVTLFISLIASLFVLWIDLPLSNDIRPLLFFYSTVRIIFFRSDYAIRSSEVGQEERQGFCLKVFSIRFSSVAISTFDA